MTTETPLVTPKLLALWVKSLREAQNCSQEALAVAAGVSIRTVQRVEDGEPSNVTTRRCLARGLGYGNCDIFEDPAFAETVHNFIETAQTANAAAAKQALEKQFPDHIPVKVAPVSSGPELARFVGQARATLLHCDDDVPRPAQEVAAVMFDLMRDLVDIWSDISFSEQLTYSDELGRMQKEIEDFDLRFYSALRHTKIVGEYWADKTPHSLTIGYLTIIPKDREIEQMMVPRRFS